MWCGLEEGFARGDQRVDVVLGNLAGVLSVDLLPQPRVDVAGGRAAVSGRGTHEPLTRDPGSHRSTVADQDAGAVEQRHLRHVLVGGLAAGAQGEAGTADDLRLSHG